MKPVVAFQGERGAYSEDAVVAYFGDDVQTLACSEFLEVFEAVESGKATHAVLPVENSIEGSVTQVNDLMLEHDLGIAGEVIVHIDHCLIGHRSAGIYDLKVVYSHPQALAQCRKFLDTHPSWKRVPVYDTAGSVKTIKEHGLPEEGAVASRRAAKVYGMKVLREGIQSDHQNYTRFFVLEKNPPRAKDADKTSIVFAAKNQPGSLLRCLEEFAKRGINLTKLESRPRRHRPWSYIFYADFDGSVDEAKCAEAIGALLRVAGFVKILGSYKRAEPPKFK